jgi:hypothetical protein
MLYGIGSFSGVLGMCLQMIPKYIFASAHLVIYKTRKSMTSYMTMTILSFGHDFLFICISWISLVVSRTAQMLCA